MLFSPLKEFYEGLCASEARHHLLYLRLAEERSNPEKGSEWRAALQRFAEIEAELVTSSDPQFRFHSGSPV